MASNRTRRLIAIGAFAVAAAAGPAFAATMVMNDGPADHLATPECLAWFGNKEDGKCLSYSNGNGINLGTPQYNYCSPGNRSRNSNCGVSTGPLLPGTTINQPVN